MIRCVSGDKILRSWSLPDDVSYRLDTEISPPCPNILIKIREAR